MGLLSAVRRRKEMREERIRDAAYAKAIAKGKSPEDAAAKADSAVRRHRRRRFIAMVTAASGR